MSKRVDIGRPDGAGRSISPPERRRSIIGRPGSDDTGLSDIARRQAVSAPPRARDFRTQRPSGMTHPDNRIPGVAETPQMAGRDVRTESASTAAPVAQARRDASSMSVGAKERADRLQTENLLSRTDKPREARPVAAIPEERTAPTTARVTHHATPERFKPSAPPPTGESPAMRTPEYTMPFQQPGWNSAPRLEGYVASESRREPDSQPASPEARDAARALHDALSQYNQSPERLPVQNPRHTPAGPGMSFASSVMSSFVRLIVFAFFVFFAINALRVCG